ncbi:MAG: AAA family ATPase [Deltaproteobacteria bacterium]|nr:AAA family ATPase [Deltaproteobacteria bacterium]
MTKPRWLRHFGFSAPPFSKEIADDALWLPASKVQIVEALVEAAVERASVLLVGDPGVGKTCVLRALRHRLPEAGFRLSYCHNATLGRRDFYRQLCLVLGLSPKATAAAVFYSVSSHVEDLSKERLHPVFLLDEAHLLHQDVLDHLHILLNYQWDSKALLSVFLVGLPELWGRLDLRRNRSLLSRIHHRIAVGPALVDDTAEYIRYRFAGVGAGKREVFSSDAVALTHEASSGILRDIDRIATACLKAAARGKHRIVDRELILHVLDAYQPFGIDA